MAITACGVACTILKSSSDESLSLLKVCLECECGTWRSCLIIYNVAISITLLSCSNSLRCFSSCFAISFFCWSSCICIFYYKIHNTIVIKIIIGVPPYAVQLVPQDASEVFLRTQPVYENVLPFLCVAFLVTPIICFLCQQLIEY